MEHRSGLRHVSLRTLAAAVLFVASLFWARDIFIPTALAVLVAFLLAPPVEWLCRHRIHNGIAVFFVTTIAGLLVVGVIALISAQVYDLGLKVDQYKGNLSEKFDSLRGMFGSITKLQNTVSELQDGVTTPRSSDSPHPTTAPTMSVTGNGAGGINLLVTQAATKSDPVPVKIINDAPGPPIILTGALALTLAPLATAGMVYVIVLFLLVERQLVVKRLRWLGRMWHMRIASELVDDAARRVGRYLLMQLLVNAMYGLMVGLALWAVGLPNALLWGFMATLLRYIPYVGPVLAAALPLTLAIAVFHGWEKPMIVLVCFVVAETITNMVLEPLLYGNSTGVSTIAVVLSTFFWGWLWGPVGLVLAMPITVCIVVIGRHIGALATLAHLMSNEEPAAMAAPASQAKPTDDDKSASLPPVTA